MLEVGSVFVSLDGSYSTDGDFPLCATFEQLDFHGLGDDFFHFFHFFQDTLSLPDIGIYIGAATVTIAKGIGFSIVVHDLRVGEHTASDGVIEVGSKGGHAESQY